MTKRNIFIAVTVIVLVLLIGGVSVFAYLSSRSAAPVAKNPGEQTVGAPVAQTPDEAAVAAAAAADFKNVVCSDSGKPLDVSVLNGKIKDSAGAAVASLSAENRSLLNGYYFCDGLVKDDPDEACGNGLKSGELTDQCKSSYSFSQTVLASLSGDKVKAESLCKANSANNSAICSSIGSFDEIRKNNLCSQLSEEELPSCLAFFNGDDSRCKGSKRESDCYASAAFMKALTVKDMKACDSLASTDQTDNYSVVCKLNADKTHAVCADTYKEFTKSFCSTSS